PAARCERSYPGDSDVDQAVARSRSQDHRRPGRGSKSVACFGAAATDHVRQSDETGIGNIGKLCGSHRLGSGGGKRFVHKQHGSERLCQGDDPSRCPRAHRRSVQLSGDGFDVYGTLAGISLWLGELGEGSLSVVNLNERNAESLCSLGLDQLFNVQVSAINKDGQALPIPLKEDRTARAQTMLEAHEALIKTAPENLPKFKDVIEYLEEELHLSK